jgi:hypothetical protein
VVSNESSTSATSNLCTLTVNAKPALPTSVTATSPICSGGTSTLSASNPTAGTTLHWYTGSCGGTEVGTGTSVTTSALTSNTTFYVRAESATCNGDCATVTVTVNPKPALPASVTATSPICSGGTSTLSASNPTAGTTLHWYTGSCGGTAVGTGTSVTTSALTSNTTFYVRAESATCNGECASITVTINPDISIALNGDQHVCQGNNAMFTATPSGGSIVQWKWYGPSGEIPGQTASAYSTSTAGSYYCMGKSSAGCWYSSPPALLIIDPLTVSSLPSSLEVCSGTSAQLAITAQCAFDFHWHVIYSNGTDLDISTEPNADFWYSCFNSPTLTIKSVTAYEGIGHYYCVVTDLYGNTVSSNTCNVTVKTCH